MYRRHNYQSVCAQELILALHMHTRGSVDFYKSRINIPRQLHKEIYLLYFGKCTQTALQVQNVVFAWNKPWRGAYNLEFYTDFENVSLPKFKNAPKIWKYNILLCILSIKNIEILYNQNEITDVLFPIMRYCKKLYFLHNVFFTF